MTNAVKTKQVVTKFATKHFRIGLIQSIGGKDNSRLLLRAAESMCELGFVFSMIASGDTDIQSKLLLLSEKYEGQFEIMESSTQNERKIMTQSNVIIFLNKPTKIELKKVMKKGIVPIVPFGSDIENFDAQSESGNGFCFSEGNFSELFATIVRSFENFKFTYDWGNLQKAVQQSA